MSPHRTAPAAFQWIVFPLVMFAAVAWAIHWMANGTAAPESILAPQLCAFAVVAVLEHVYPYHRSWNRPRRDVRVDATHSISIALMVGLATPFMLAGGVALGGWLSSEIGTGLWPAGWPLLAQTALALVLGELPGYWVHRFEHEWEGLWRFHATHHSAPRLGPRYDRHFGGSESGARARRNRPGESTRLEHRLSLVVQQIQVLRGNSAVGGGDGTRPC